MTQLDMFSLAPAPEAKENKPLPLPQQNIPAMVKQNKVDDSGVIPQETTSEQLENLTVTNNLTDSFSVQEKVELTPEPLPGRSGDIVFEDSRISVKIKARPTPRKESAEVPQETTPTAPVKRYGLPSLPELSGKVEPRKSIVTKQPKSAFSDALREKLDSVKNGIKDGLLKEAISEKKKQEKAARVPQKRGRKSFKEIETTVDLLNIPDDEELFKKQYYPISEVAGWFNVNTSLLRFWENEFDILKPRKNRKGDRMFRPEDVKSLQLIYELLRQRKYSIEGAKEFLKNNRGKADVQVQLTQTLQKFRSFLLELKANL